MEMRPVVESNVFIAGLFNWRIFLTHYFGGFLPPYDSQISAVIFTRIISIGTYLNNFKLYN
jgi:hypothetical protein